MCEHSLCKDCNQFSYRLRTNSTMRASILQFVQLSLSYHLSLRSLFCLYFEWPLKTGFTDNFYIWPSFCGIVHRVFECDSWLLNRNLSLSLSLSLSRCYWDVCGLWIVAFPGYICLRIL